MRKPDLQEKINKDIFRLNIRKQKEFVRSQIKTKRIKI